jgi:hypothetical protein
MSYQEVLKKFEQIQQDINSSNHDRMSYEDYEASPEEIHECMKGFGLHFSNSMTEEYDLPVEFWNEAFGETEDTQVINRIMDSTEYKKLAEIYEDLYEQVVHIATESSAYYNFEAEQEEKYLNSVRWCV